MEIITRASAKRRGLSRFYTGNPCKHGHMEERYVSSGVCILCDRIKHIRWQQNNKEAHKERVYAWRRANPERSSEIAAGWRKRNADRYSAIQATNQIRQKYGTRLTDPYAAIIPFYAEERRLTRETGIKHQVDHVIPLSRGGPHCASNLRVITALENQRKGNR